MVYEAVIGLEVHVELNTKSKIFCGCEAKFGGSPNTHVCPVCLGLPGALPMLNKKVVECAIKAGLALNCSIAKLSRMDRKNYFYPDCPKSYQITQYEIPLCKNGYMDIELKDGRLKKINIERIHIEEDAGKLLHNSEGTLVDFNRAGIPLIEIVSAPDIRSGQEATLYLEKLKSILTAIGISDCKMEEGSLRCDCNISIRPEGSKVLGTKSEIKNMNSFKALEKALNYEYMRQANAVKNGQKLTSETRRWDEINSVTVMMRNKEQDQDYRYFPEGDLVTINIGDQWIEKIKATIPELPHEKEERFVKEYGIPAYDSKVLTSSMAMADFFEATAKESEDGKATSNWLMGDVSRLMKEQDINNIQQLKFTPKQLAELIKLINAGAISNNIGKMVLEEMFVSGKCPKKIIEEKGLLQNNDEEAIGEIIRSVLKANPKSLEDYKNGKTKVIGFLVGLVMKESKGKANPKLVNKLMDEELTMLI